MKSKSKIIYLCSILFIVSCSSKEIKTIDKPKVKTQKEIIGKWILLSDFNDDTLIFKKQCSIDTNETWLKEYTFKKDKIEFNYLKVVPRCGNGLITIDSMNWKLNRNKIQLFTKAHEITYKFQYLKEYHQLKSKKDRFILVLDSIIHSEFIDLMKLNWTK